MPTNPVQKRPKAEQVERWKKVRKSVGDLLKAGCENRWPTEQPKTYPTLLGELMGWTGAGEQRSVQDLLGGYRESPEVFRKIWRRLRDEDDFKSPTLEAHYRYVFPGAGHGPVETSATFEEGVKCLRERWAKAKSIALIHINGQTFREERLRWFHEEKCQIQRDAGFRYPSDAFSETPDEALARVSAELVAGPEPCGVVERFWAFIPTAEQYRIWERANGVSSVFESHASAKLFWIGYILRLRQRNGGLRRGKADARPMDARLFEYNTMGLTGYYLDWDEPDREFYGALSIWGVETRHEPPWHLDMSRHADPRWKVSMEGLSNLQKLASEVEVSVKGWAQASQALRSELSDVPGFMRHPTSLEPRS